MSKTRKHRFFLYLLLEGFRRFILLLPRRAGYALAKWIGVTTYWILPKERAESIRHLEIALGKEERKGRYHQIGQAAFVHLAETAIDVLQFPRLNRKRIERLVRLESGTQKLDQALARGKGVIALTGHLGNWELLASYFRFLGYPGQLLGRRIYYEPFDRILVSLRKSALVSTIYRDESPRKVLAALKQNEVIGMSADQDIDSLEGIFIPFFGKDAWTPTGPAKIALASGAAIVPAFMIHEEDRYRLFIEDPILPPEFDSKEAAIRQMTEAWSQVVERYVCQFPDQWVWMHNRWKTKMAPQVKLGETMHLEKVAS